MSAGRARFWLLLLSIGLALSLGFRLGETPIDTSREARTWHVMQGMVESGDWLVPRVEGEVRLVKPPLFYWSTSACAVVLGGADRFALRLPSVLAAIGLAWLVFRWGRSIGGPELGLLAVSLLWLMALVVSYGRIGLAEMELVLFSNLALFAFDRALSGSGRRLLPAFALCTALAVLAKATTALLVIGLPIAVTLLLQRRLRDAFRWPVLGWVSLGVLVGFSWYVVILAVVPEAWDTLRMAVALPLGLDTGEVRATGKHYAPFWYFGAKLLSDMLPAILLLPLAVFAAVRTRLWCGDGRRSFLAVVFLSLFVAISIIPQKQKHYLLPLMPALAILIADSALSLCRRRPVLARRLMTTLGVLAALFGAGVLALLVVFYGDILGSATWALGAGILVGLGLIVGVVRAGLRARPLLLAGLCVTASLALTAVNYGSLDLWQEQFEAGTVQLREDYDAARWDRAFERYPALRDMIGENRLGHLGAPDDG
jgi:4-amino-4-deoxy-L-arabinose transferase-like glycosyltransferase